MNVSFRVDAGARIGNGHLMRCLSLADALSERGASTSFICEAGVAVELERAVAQNHKVLDIPAQGTLEKAWSESRDAYHTLRVISEARLEPDWLVVDHYHLAREWEDQVRPAVKKLLVIDDLANR